MLRLTTSSANSLGVQCVTGRPLASGSSQATAKICVTCSAVNLPGEPLRGRLLSSSVMALGSADGFSQHSTKIKRWNASAHGRCQGPTA